jgi:hypothetical protein
VDAEVAQLVEQRTENAWVPGSSPGLGTSKSLVENNQTLFVFGCGGDKPSFEYNAIVGVQLRKPLRP